MRKGETMNQIRFVPIIATMILAVTISVTLADDDPEEKNASTYTDDMFSGPADSLAELKKIEDPLERRRGLEEFLETDMMSVVRAWALKSMFMTQFEIDPVEAFEWGMSQLTVETEPRAHAALYQEMLQAFIALGASDNALKLIDFMVDHHTLHPAGYFAMACILLDTEWGIDAAITLADLGARERAVSDFYGQIQQYCFEAAAKGHIRKRDLESARIKLETGLALTEVEPDSAYVSLMIEVYDGLGDTERANECRARLEAGKD